MAESFIHDLLTRLANIPVRIEREEVIERPPYPNVEHQSRRAYIFARKPIYAQQLRS